MEDIFFPLVLDRHWKPQICQYLAVTTMDGGDCLKSRSINHAHPGKGRINFVRIQLAIPHLFLEPFDIKYDWRRLTLPDRLSLAMDGFLLLVLAVNFVVDLRVVSCG